MTFFDIHAIWVGMLRLKNRNLVPDGGFRYYYDETAYLCRGANYHAWQNKCAEHEKANGLRERTEAEREDWLCHVIDPVFVERGGTRGRLPRVEEIKSFLTTLVNRHMGDVDFVPQGEADRRAGICASCPHNNRVLDCTTCEDIASKAMGITREKKTKHDNMLEGCGICGCYLRVKVWMEKEILEKRNDYPEWCWMA